VSQSLLLGWFLLAGDPSKDVAVLQIDAPAEVLANMKPIELGQSSGLVVGQQVGCSSSQRADLLTTCASLLIV
jgi:hypothetical protein